MHRLRQEGKAYLAHQFPQLSYITRCQSVDSKLHEGMFLLSSNGAVSAQERESASQARGALDVATTAPDPYHISLRR